MHQKSRLSLGLRSLFSILLLLFLASPAHSAVTKKAKCSADGGTRYTLSVTFLTGAELNLAISDGFNQFSPYSGLSVYACVWFGQNECAIVKLRGIFASGSGSRGEMAVQSRDILDMMTYSGEDNSGRSWRIQAWPY